MMNFESCCEAVCLALARYNFVCLAPSPPWTFEKKKMSERSLPHISSFVPKAQKSHESRTSEEPQSRQRPHYTFSDKTCRSFVLRLFRLKSRNFFALLVQIGTNAVQTNVLVFFSFQKFMVGVPRTWNCWLRSLDAVALLCKLKICETSR